MAVIIEDPKTMRRAYKNLTGILATDPSDPAWMEFAEWWASTRTMRIYVRIWLQREPSIDRDRALEYLGDQFVAVSAFP